MQLFFFFKFISFFRVYTLFPNTLFLTCLFSWGTSKASQLSVLTLYLLSCPQNSFLSRVTYCNEWGHNVYNCASQKPSIWPWSVLVSHQHSQYFFIYYWYYLLSNSHNCLFILTLSSASPGFIFWTTLIAKGFHLFDSCFFSVHSIHDRVIFFKQRSYYNSFHLPNLFSAQPLKVLATFRMSDTLRIYAFLYPPILF